MIDVLPMQYVHRARVAALHCASIRTGLIASLGQRFCQALYWGMARSPHGFVLVARADAGMILGYVCCAIDVTRLYRNVILRRGPALAATAIGGLARPAVLREMWKSVRRPARFRGGDFAAWDLPETELVAIAVDPTAQGRGVGHALVQSGLARLRAAGCERIRVWTSADNDQAMRFYRKQGFELLGTRRHHVAEILVFARNL